MMLNSFAAKNDSLSIKILVIFRLFCRERLLSVILPIIRRFLMTCARELYTQCSLFDLFLSSHFIFRLP